jgi:hypothetical protein
MFIRSDSQTLMKRSKETVLVNGLGCTVTGGEVVLCELLKAIDDERDYWVLCPDKTAVRLVGKKRGSLSKNVRLIGLPHRIFGCWFRPLVELAVGLSLKLGVVRSVVNLSNYGVCFGGDYVLYIHSPLVMAQWTPGNEESKPGLFLKQRMLDSCIRRARLITLQTQGMAAQLEAYCDRRKLRRPRYRLVRPLVRIPKPGQARRIFQFQLFYPASSFAHKRPELAEAGARVLHAAHPETGLVITQKDGDKPPCEGILRTGLISRQEVHEWLAGSDVMLFTSAKETLGLPLLEALEIGLPVVAPRLPYAMEILGEAGCYFDEATPEAVAAAVTSCRRDYEKWKRLAADRLVEINKTSASWSEHWMIWREHLA